MKCTGCIIATMVLVLGICVHGVLQVSTRRLDEAKYVQGAIVETDYIEIDEIKSEYWRKIVIETTSGQCITLNVSCDEWDTLSKCSFVSIRFKRDGTIKDYAYEKADP